MDRYGNQMAAQTDRSYGVETASALKPAVQETVRSAIERLAKIEDHLASLTDRASTLRDSVRPSGPQNGAINAAKPPYSGVVGSLHGLTDAISDRVSALDRLLAEIQQALG